MYVCIYLSFVALLGPSLVATSGGSSSLQSFSPWRSLSCSTGSRHPGSGVGAGALLLPGTWGLPGPGSILCPCTGGHVLTTETFTGSSNAPAPPGGGRAPPATSAGALPASQGVRATSDSTPAGSRPPPLEQPPENLLHRPLMGRRCTGRLTGNTSRGLRPKGSHLQQGYDGRFRKRPCHCWLRCSIVSRSIRVQSSPFRIGVQRASLCSRARISAGVSRVSLAACTASGNLAAEAGARQQRGGLGREGR